MMINTLERIELKQIEIFCYFNDNMMIYICVCGGWGVPPCYLLRFSTEMFFFACVQIIFLDTKRHARSTRSAFIDARLCFCRTTVWTSSSASSGTTPGSPTPSTLMTLWTWTRLCWTLYGNRIFFLPTRKGLTFMKWPQTTNCSGYLRMATCCTPSGKSAKLKVQLQKPTEKWPLCVNN